MATRTFLFRILIAISFICVNAQISAGVAADICERFKKTAEQLLAMSAEEKTAWAAGMQECFTGKAPTSRPSTNTQQCIYALGQAEQDPSDAAVCARAKSNIIESLKGWSGTSNITFSNQCTCVVVGRTIKNCVIETHFDSSIHQSSCEQSTLNTYLGR